MRKLFFWLVKHNPKLKEDFLHYLVEKEPFLAAEIFAKDFLGIIPNKSVDNSALQFLAKYRHIMEPWLIGQAYRLQKERVIYGDKGSFFDGALLVIRLLYAKTIKFAPQTEQPISPNQPEKKLTPEEDIESFLTGMKEKKSDGQRQDSGSETAKV